MSYLIYLVVKVLFSRNFAFRHLTLNKDKSHHSASRTDGRLK